MKNVLTHIAILILGLEQRKKDYKAGSPRWIELEETIWSRYKSLDSEAKGKLIDRISALKRNHETDHDWIAELQNH